MGDNDNAGNRQGSAVSVVEAMNGTRMSPVWGEQLGLGTGVPGFLAAGIDPPRIGESVVNGAFHAGDWALHHGGQLMLDAAGFIPGVNVLTEGLQVGYHAVHAGWDAYEGNTKGAETEVGEAAWHAALMGLNVATGAGGKAVEEAKAAEEVAEGTHAVKTGATVAEEVETAKAVGDGAQGAKAATQGGTAAARALELAEEDEFYLHAAHLLADTSEVAWDLTATMYQMMSGDDEKLPFLGGLGPWILGGAGREEDAGGKGTHK